jgi:hypothetical protein
MAGEKVNDAEKLVGAAILRHYQTKYGLSEGQFNTLFFYYIEWPLVN